MQKKTSLLFGVTLIVLALLGLAGNLIVQATGRHLTLGFNTWPLAVIGAGLLFCIPPFVFNKMRGLSGLFIPGLPVLATGAILFIASVTGNWHIWASLWPLEVISVAVGFLLMAFFLNIVWLTIPASIIGFVGLVLQFCAVTGLWASWAVLWTIVPFAVGLPLLLIGIFKKIDGVKLAGLILVGIAGLAFAAMSALISSTSLIVRLIGPALVLVLGAFLVISAVVNRPGKTTLNETEK